MTTNGMNELKSELAGILNERALAYLESEPNALLAWVADADEAYENGDHKIELRARYTKSGNPEEIWFDEDWFTEE